MTETNTSTTKIKKGLPNIPQARKGFFTKTHGFYSMGTNDASNLLDKGRGSHIEKVFPVSNKGHYVSYIAGARIFNKRKGSPFTIAQRKNGDNLHVFICFTSDLEGISE